MSSNTVVVGVDATLEATGAAVFGARFAEAAHTRCVLVHVVREPRAPIGMEARPATPGDTSPQERGRETVVRALSGSVPTPLLEQLLVRSGRAPVALREAALELHAGLIVIGGKHHTVPGEWLGRSTAMHLARTADVPVLVTGSGALPCRVLAAVDASAAARVTLESARQLAEVCGAELRVLSVVELLPLTTETPFGYVDPGFYSGYYESATTVVEREVWPLVTGADVQKRLRFGRTLETIIHEADGWPADLLVVGSHGRGWVERALLGSVTERLLHLLPTSLLVVPAYAAFLPHGPMSRGT